MKKISFIGFYIVLLLCSHLAIAIGPSGVSAYISYKNQLGDIKTGLIYIGDENSIQSYSEAVNYVKKLFGSNDVLDVFGVAYIYPNVVKQDLLSNVIVSTTNPIKLSAHKIQLNGVIAAYIEPFGHVETPLEKIDMDWATAETKISIEQYSYSYEEGGCMISFFSHSGTKNISDSEKNIIESIKRNSTSKKPMSQDHYQDILKILKKNKIIVTSWCYC